jgi:nucleotide-binding universal stress UspA family protein
MGGAADESACRILVWLTGPEETQAALERAIQRAHRRPARLWLVYVVPRVPPFVAFGAMSPLQLEPEALATAEKILRRAAATVPADIPLTTRAVVGITVPTLLREARNGCCDLIIAGVQKPPRAPWSTVAKLKRRSPVPVELVALHPEERRRKRAKPRPAHGRLPSKRARPAG